MDAVVHHEPAVGGLDRRRSEADLAGVPPGAVAGLEQQRVIAPVTQVGRERDPHVGSAAQGRRAMDHRPAAAEPDREERRVLVFGRHGRPEAGDGPEVPGHRERHERPAAAVGGVRDRPLLALGEPRDARILAAPDLLGVALDIGAQQRLGVEPPVRGAVRAPRDMQLRDPAHVLDAHEEDRLVTDARRGRVEHGVRGVRKVRGRQDRVGLGPPEDLVRSRHAIFVTNEPAVRCDSDRPVLRVRTGVRATSLRTARMCSAAVSHISVDSAPWFVFTPCGVRPS